MSVLSLSGALLCWENLSILDHANFSLNTGERIGLIGRNGAGKTTFFKVLTKEIPLDEGELRIASHLHVVHVSQEPQLSPAQTLLESLEGQANSPSLDEEDRFSMRARLRSYMERLQVAENVSPEKASGGERKRAALALALALQPDLLLLDEPTNHLDIDSIRTLETILREEYRGSRCLIVITHDRAFLDSVTTRIVELDRGQLRSYDGNFQTYEETKEQELHAETLQRRRFDKFLAQEEVWIRKGIEARRTRNEGRVRRLEQLRNEYKERRDRPGSVCLRLDAGERSGKVVLETENLTKSFGSKPIVNSLSFKLMRKEKLGILGKSGIGKSTLLKLLLGELAPDSGTVKFGTNLSVAYYDQLREQLDPNKTVIQTISPGSDWIEIADTRKHVMSYLADFLFPPNKANAYVSTLSGGERNRLLLARLFALPANLLVLDEPTNDLDIDTIELLEDTISRYSGSVILVSHDRRFLDNVVTRLLVPKNYEIPDGKWEECVGGYEDWLRTHTSDAASAAKVKSANPPASKKPRTTATKRLKLSYKEEKELLALPGQIEQLETEQSELMQKLSSTDYHKRGVDEIKADKERMNQLPHLIDAAYERWELLSKKQEESQH